MPVHLSEPSEQATFLDDGRVLANYLLWGVWFPLVFLSVVITGRRWCGFLCPMGAASELANRHGLKRQVPAWVRWPGTPILSFILITLLGQTTGVRDHPEAALETFGGTFVLAVIVGWLWGRNKRVWCRHLCPIGLLLGAFAPPTSTCPENGPLATALNACAAFCRGIPRACRYLSAGRGGNWSLFGTMRQMAGKSCLSSWGPEWLRVASCGWCLVAGRWPLADRRCRCRRGDDR